MDPLQLQLLIERIIRYIDQPRTGFSFDSVEIVNDIILVMVSTSRNLSVEQLAVEGNTLISDLEEMAYGTGMRINMIVVGT